MKTAYLGLGSNRGDRREHLREALYGLESMNDIRVEAVSPIYNTEAHTLDPDEEQRSFLNAVAEVCVMCSPEELLRRAHQVEAEEGRVRDGREKWSPRPLDVDLLVVGSVTCRTDTLTLPHPRLAERNFVLRPWADLAPTYRVPPPFDASVQSLLKQCPDTSSIRKSECSLSLPVRSQREHPK